VYISDARKYIGIMYIIHIIRCVRQTQKGYFRDDRRHDIILYACRFYIGIIGSEFNGRAETRSDRVES